MSTGRKLGGGRILGSGKSLAPVPPAKDVPLRSPSSSSRSVASSILLPPPNLRDLSSQISLENHDDFAISAAAAAANAQLVCPICNEDMVTLLQLNRHLDDTHKNLEEVRQDEAKDWFERQLVKAKRFQPLAVLNQKFKSLDVFESNEVARSPNLRPANTSNAATAVTQQTKPPNPDDVVTRQHWQRRTPEDRCSDPTCGRPLGSQHGCVNCRHCGKLFCNEHTMYQMKLSRSAQHEPVRGHWCRVCETCYKSREGYNDRHGLETDRMAEFDAIRRKKVDQTLLDISRLEKRLSKLTQLLANPAPEPTTATSLLWPVLGVKSNRKELEQSIVDWEEDATVPKCPFCEQDFSSFGFRRHHCRVCGRVVCADVGTDCSQEVPLMVEVAAKIMQSSEKAYNQVALDVRICKSCRHTLFSRRDFFESLRQNPPHVKAFENLLQFERGIRMLLPRFHHLVSVLQSTQKPPTPREIADASKTRKRLVDAFGQYSAAARRLRDLPTSSPTEQRLQQAIYEQSYQFLQLHMLPLKALPKLLKHASPAGPQARGPLASIRRSSFATPSQVSASSADITVLEAEEKVLHETLIVLEEQLFFVKEQMADASKKRKYDEVSSLGCNVDDLQIEVDRVKKQLEGLDFASAYAPIAPDKV